MDSRIIKGQKEAQDILAKYNHSLFNEKQLQCLKMRADGLSLKVIGQKLDITKQGVDDFIKRAKKQIV